MRVSSIPQISDSQGSSKLAVELLYQHDHDAHEQKIGNLRCRVLVKECSSRTGTAPIRCTRLRHSHDLCVV